MTLPRFLCIGAQKAGTSWLFARMAEHPKIWMPPVKELHYFDHLFCPENRKWTHWHLKINSARSLRWHVRGNNEIDWSFVAYLTDLVRKEVFTAKWYERCFDRPGAKVKIPGDITPEYSTIPLEGVQFVHDNLPNVKIIYIIRDPVERALSQIRMNVERSKVEPSEQVLLDMCDVPDISNRGDYKSYVSNWESVFPAERLLIIPYGHIKKQPAQVMRSIEDLLGIEHHANYKLHNREHSTQQIDIPDSVKEKLKTKFHAQYEFLRQRFGAAFIEECR
jgi:hypothetical protein